MSRQIYRESALRRYSDPSTHANKPLVISGMWFVLFWGVVALLGAGTVGLTVIRVPDLTTVQATVTRYITDPAPHLEVTAQVPGDRAVPHAGDETTVRLAGRPGPLTCRVTDPGGIVVGVEELRKRFGTAAGPARLTVLSCDAVGGEPERLLRRTGEAVIETGTIAAGSLLFGADS